MCCKKQNKDNYSVFCNSNQNRGRLAFLSFKQVRYDSLCLSHNRMQSVLYVSCRSLQVIYSKWCWLFWKCQSLLFLRHTGTSCQFASMEYYCSPDFLFYLHDIQYLGLLCLKKHLYIQYLTGSTCFTYTSLYIWNLFYIHIWKILLVSWLRLNVSLFYLHFKCFCYDFSVFFINNWSCRVKGRTWFSQRKSWHNWHNRPVVFGLLICCSCCCLEVILIINANAIHPFSSAYPVQGHGEWESILASIKQEAGYTRMYPARHRANAI